MRILYAFLLFLSSSLLNAQLIEKDFLSQLGVCTNLAKYPLLKGVGYTYVEESVGRFLVPEMIEDSFQVRLAQMKSLGANVYSCNSFIPAKLKSVGQEANHKAILDYASIAIRRASEAGVKTIVFGSGVSRKIPEGFSKDSARIQFVSLLKEMAPIAQKYNVVISIEVLNSGETNFINSLAEGASIVNEVNQSHIKLLADIYHMMRDDEPAIELYKYSSIIFHCHIAERETRTAPGIAGDDFVPYLKALYDGAYKRRLSMECKWTSFNDEIITAYKTIEMQRDKAIAK